MLRIAILAAVVLLAAAFATGLLRPDSRETPEDAYRAIDAAGTSGDVEAFWDRLSAQSQAVIEGNGGKEAFAAMLRQTAERRKQNASAITHVEVRGDVATLTMEGGQSMRMVFEGGQWKMQINVNRAK